VKLITVQQYTSSGVEALGPAAITLAECEGLKAHAEAVRTRLGHV
jgi:histidinol dehydrogenase